MSPANRNKKKIFLGILCIVFLGALLFFLPKMYLKVMEKNIHKISIRQTKIKKDTVEMYIQIDLSEKWIPVAIDSISYSSEVYGKTIAEGITRLNPHKRYDKPLTFPVKISNELLKEEIKKHQGDCTEVKMHISQYINFPLIPTQSVEVVKLVHMRIPIIPEVKISNVEVLDFGLDDMRMLVTLSINNPNNMDFTIKQMKSSVQVKDYATSYSGSDKNVHIKKMNTSEITVPVSTDIKHEVKALWKTLKGDTEWPYYFKSMIILDPSDEQIDDIYMETEKHGTVDIKKSIKAFKNKEKVDIDEND